MNHCFLRDVMLNLATIVTMQDFYQQTSGYI